ncbi:deoxycytidylate deaminase-like [Scomber japonicus]|uniref:deoxycytidylate deaminase-like n=1 Tax=Scomber japonicus TaxID=13676 RepID=UPI0023064B21|nr:deoxycytidylate deaminase-like [Scomber japonicus]
MERRNQKQQPDPSNSLKRKREECLDCSDYFMAVAVLTANMSQDPSTQVGACIVNQDNKIVGTGHNQMPKGGEDMLPWERTGDDELKTKYLYVSHAELNAFMNSPDVKDCTIYVTLFPCNECTKLIIQGGIKKVVYLSDKYKEDKLTIASKTMLGLAGIPYEQFIPKNTAEIDININPN